MAVHVLIDNKLMGYDLGVACSVLVANNRMAAVDFTPDNQKWSYNLLGHERAINPVASISVQDTCVGAQCVSMADPEVEVLGHTNANHYATLQHRGAGQVKGSDA